MSLVMIADDFPPAVGGIQTYAYELARANPWSRVADLYLRLYRDKGAT